MTPVERLNTITDESSRLREARRNLAVLSWLADGWSGLDAEGIFRDLADGMFRVLPLEFVWFTSRGGREIDRMRFRDGVEREEEQLLKAALAPWVAEGCDEDPITLPEVGGKGAMRCCPAVAAGGEVLVIAGTREEHFPNAEESLLMEHAAGQLDLALRHLELARLENELREQDLVFRAAFNQQTQFGAILGLDGRILEANEICFRYSGMDPRPILGRFLWETPWWERIVIGQQQWKAAIFEAGRTGGTLTCELACTVPDGSVRNLTTTVTGLRDEAGRITRLLVEGFDDTERREQESALRQSEERLRLALEAGKMGVWDWNIRTGGLEWSDSLEPLHGLAPNTFGGTFEAFQELIHPDDRDRVQEAIEDAVREGTGYEIELRNVRPDGAVNWIAAKGKVFPGDDGTPERMIGIGMDVTDQKRAERTARFLADASAELAVLVDYDATLRTVASMAVPNFADWAAVDTLEANGSLRRVAVAHVDPAKVKLAHELHRRFPPDPSAPQGAWKILRSGEPELVREIPDEMLVMSTREEEHLRILRQLGLKSYIGVPLKVRGKTRTVLTFVMAESGHVYDATDLAVAQDLAARAAIAIENAHLYRELREADRRKDEFVATLAHELRNPLAPIRSGLEVQRLAGADDERAEKARSMMERQLNQMVRLVDDLLDVSRITRNQLELRKQRIELQAVLQSAVETSRPLIEQGRHTLDLRLPETPVQLDADPTRLAQVFSNLLNNSAKYTEPGGQISLSAELEGTEVTVRVQDNGLGIQVEALPRLFQMFSQVGNEDRSQGGLGIGLMLVRRLVEMHGGTVKALSDGPGRGSEFVVSLPFEVPVEVADAPDTGDTGGSAGTKRRILIVDDNEDAATSFGIMLELMGHETRSAFDGLAAVEAASDFRPSLILLDIGLPKLNGYDVCRRIREMPWAKQTVIVAVTGWGQEEDRLRSQEAGFDHHFTKPVEISALKRLLM